MGKKKRYLVVGLGRFGASLAGALTDAGHDVLAVDQDMARVDAIKHRVAFAAQLDSTNAQALRSVHVPGVDTAVVAMGGSFEAAALTVLALKHLGVPEILARARSPERGAILSAIGATRVIDLESEMATKIASALTV